MKETKKTIEICTSGHAGGFGITPVSSMLFKSRNNDAASRILENLKIKNDQRCKI